MADRIKCRRWLGSWRWYDGFMHQTRRTENITGSKVSEWRDPGILIRRSRNDGKFLWPDGSLLCRHKVTRVPREGGTNAESGQGWDDPYDPTCQSICVNLWSPCLYQGEELWAGCVPVCGKSKPYLGGERINPGSQWIWTVCPQLPSPHTRQNSCVAWWWYGQRILTPRSRSARLMIRNMVHATPIPSPIRHTYIYLRFSRYKLNRKDFTA